MWWLTGSALTAEVYEYGSRVLRYYGISLREKSPAGSLLNTVNSQVMRKPEGRSSLGPILQNLGLKQGKEFPSPQQFVKHEFGMDPTEETVSFKQCFLDLFFPNPVRTFFPESGSGSAKNPDSIRKFIFGEVPPKLNQRTSLRSH